MKSNWHEQLNLKKAVLRAMLALACLGTSAGFLASRSAAYSLKGGWNWGKTTLSYRDANGAGSVADTGANRWSGAARLRFTKVSSGEDITIYYSNAGNSGWYALTHGNGSGGSPYDSGFWCTPGGTNITRNGYYSTSTALQDENVWTHEFGHAAGLNHSDATYPCGSSFGIVAVMYYGVGCYDNPPCNNTGPTSDDLSGVDVKY